MTPEIIMCLALTAWHEAKGESDKGKIAVMEVVHNRTKNPNFPNHECSVVRQKWQFSWYKSGMSLNKPPINIKSTSADVENWNKTKTLAKNFSKNKTNYTKGSLFFNHQRLGVRFGNTLKCKIGNHVFF